MIAAVQKSLFVPLPPQRAFDLFTRDMASWWPGETHSLSANTQSATPKSLMFETELGGKILETCADGEIRAWATVTTWEPGARFVLAWYVGRTEAEATTVDVKFESENEGTRLTLTHSGFEALGEDGQRIRDSYNGGWDGVLGDAFHRQCTELVKAA